jgi:hypothetical protein
MMRSLAQTELAERLTPTELQVLEPVPEADYLAHCCNAGRAATQAGGCSGALNFRGGAESPTWASPRKLVAADCRAFSR